jgi:prolyl-tRNA synthetase
MGSYGIGIERIAAAYIEQNHDKDGIIWGGEISPFQIHLISVNKKTDSIKIAAEKLYNELLELGYDVLFDDRDDISPGFKFKDADLIGVPLQLVVSDKNMKNDEIEVKFRRSGERVMIKYSDILNRLPNLMEKL